MPKKHTRVLPKHRFRAVTLAGYLPTCSETSEVGLLLDGKDGTVTRVRLSWGDSEALLLNLLCDYIDLKCVCQSAMSSGSPSVDGLVTPGQSQSPLTSESSARCGVGCPQPSRSSSCSMHQLNSRLQTMVNTPIGEPCVKANGDDMDVSLAHAQEGAQ